MPAAASMRMLKCHNIKMPCPLPLCSPALTVVMQRSAALFLRLPARPQATILCEKVMHKKVRGRRLGES